MHPHPKAHISLGSKFDDSAFDERKFPVCFANLYIFLSSDLSKGQDYEMVFPTRDIKNYISVDVTEEMSEMTLVFWINTVESEDMNLVSYAVQGNHQEVRLDIKVDIMNIQFKSKNRYVNGSVSRLHSTYAFFIRARVRTEKLKSF